MPYFSDLNTYLHNSSLLLQAYPSARITTKYSLPKNPRPSKNPSKATTTGVSSTTTPRPATASTEHIIQQQRPPSSTLTLKTFHPESGICLKYKTDKAAEVGRLLTGLGRLAAGEVIEMPTVGAMEKMDVDTRPETPQVAEEVKVEPQTRGPGGGGGKGKKKKGKS